MKKELTVNCKIHNRYDVWKENVITGEKKQVAYAENIVLNQYWSKISTSIGYDGSSPRYAVRRICAGRSTGELDPARTSMFSEIFTKDASRSGPTYDYDNNIVSMRFSVTRSESEDVGEFYREIGCKNAEGTYGATAYLVSHALLMDMNGNPTVIEKTNTDIITFYATWYLYVPEFEWYGGSVKLATIAFPLFAMMMGASSPGDNETVGYIRWYLYYGNPYSAAAPSSVSIFYGTASSGSSGQNNAVWIAAERKFRFSFRIPAGTNSTSDVNGIWHVIGYYGGTTFLHLFLNMPWYDFIPENTWYPGSDIVGEQIGTGDGERTKFATAFAFAKNATIKIDGVTVDSADVAVTEMYPPKSPYGDRIMLVEDETNLRYNPYFATIGYKAVFGQYFKVECSNDGENWVEVALNSSGTNMEKSIDAAYRNYKYWRSTASGASSTYLRVKFLYDDDDPLGPNNVVFDNPPGKITAENVGTGDATETVFDLDHEPVDGSLVLEVNSVEMVLDTDYTLSGATITFANPPASGHSIVADYGYACIITADYTTPIINKDINHVFDFEISLVFNEYTEE